MHVSSAYVNSKLQSVDEILYPAPADVETIVELTNKLDSGALEAKTPEILNGHSNPYTFTKHLAEHEVANGGLPATIVRPSMSEFAFYFFNKYTPSITITVYFKFNFMHLVTAAWKEPIPGWTVSKNGPQGFLMGASKGIVRRLPVGKNLIYDYIPIDIVVNSLIVAAYTVDRDR